MPEQAQVPEKSAFSDYLRTYMAEEVLSHADVATRARTTEKTVYMWLIGKGPRNADAVRALLEAKRQRLTHEQERFDVTARIEQARHASVALQRRVIEFIDRELRKEDGRSEHPKSRRPQKRT